MRFGGMGGRPPLWGVCLVGLLGLGAAGVGVLRSGQMASKAVGAGDAPPVWPADGALGWLLDLLWPGRAGFFVGLLGLLPAGLSAPVGEAMPTPTAAQSLSDSNWGFKF